MEEAFVYKWTNKENGMYYIGKHKGTDNDGYISSGKAFLSSYNADPDMFYRDIVYRGTDRECLNMEQKLIKQALNIDGYEKLYNATAWALLKEWKRTCTWCNSVVDPRNTVWLKSFSELHFENCSKNPKNIEWEEKYYAHRIKRIKQLKRLSKGKRTTKTEDVVDITIPSSILKINAKIDRLMRINNKENGFKYADDIRDLRKWKKSLLEKKI